MISVNQGIRTSVPEKVEKGTEGLTSWRTPCTSENGLHQKGVALCGFKKSVALPLLSYKITKSGIKNLCLVIWHFLQYFPIRKPS